MIRLKPLLFAILILTTSLVVTVDSLAVMSVDLGTEFMKIAVVKPGIPMEIALNK
jgi:hypoxia up-regulated 1